MARLNGFESHPNGRVFFRKIRAEPRILLTICKRLQGVYRWPNQARLSIVSSNPAQRHSSQIQASVPYEPKFSGELLPLVAALLMAAVDGMWEKTSNQCLTANNLRNRLVFKLHPSTIHPVPHVVLVKQAGQILK